MAHMYPREPHADTKSQAELKLFAEFERQLPDDFTIFHSVAWQLRSKHRDVRDGETDFLLVHPDFGILIIEVKGGRIQYDGQSEQWRSNEHIIKDPFKQGRDNKYSLLEKLRELPFWRDRWITIGYSVAFPDVVVKSDLRLDAPRELIMDATDLSDLTTWASNALRYLRAKRLDDEALGHTGVSELISTLSSSWELRPLLATEFRQENEVIAKLTTEQLRMLDFLSRHRRAAISGCAGSGKTTLAYEKACRLAEQGFKTWLTCFNKPLAEKLNALGEHPMGLTISNFHHLANEFVQQAGFPAPGSYDSNYFEKVLPESLLKAVDILGSQFDAIVVDEGQDVSENWWMPLQYLLHDPDDGIFYVFFDDNQNIYKAARTVPVNMAPYLLTQNCRNTQAIHKQVMQFYHSDISPTAMGPNGYPVEHLVYGSEHELKKHLQKILHRLIYEEGIPAADIVLLTPKAQQRSQIWEFGQLGNFILTDSQTYSDNEIFCTTVHRFKGLESPVVILAEIDNQQVWNLDSILYVGCSRAQHYLVILSSSDTPEKISTKLRVP